MRFISGKYVSTACLLAWLTQAMFGGTLLVSSPVHADEQAKQDVASDLPVYIPPRRGAPVSRVGGGTRGQSGDTPWVQVLTPAHTGLTSQPQPVLYWYLSKAATTRFEFVLISDEGYEPLVESELKSIDQAGIHRIQLADYGITLQPDISYQWSVVVVTDAEHRSSDIISSGEIERVKPPAGIMTRVANSHGEDRVSYYASTGLWYDALQSLDDLIMANPGNERLLKARASLLEQVGLGDVATAMKGE